MAQRGQDRRAEETEEQRNSRLSDMAQRGQERRAEETEEQRNRRLAVKGQRSQQRRAVETEEQRKENTFWGERNVYVSDNICKKKKSEASIWKLVIKRLDLKEYLHFFEKLMNLHCFQRKPEKRVCIYGCSLPNKNPPKRLWEDNDDLCRADGTGFFLQNRGVLKLQTSNGEHFGTQET
ncbi:hypothetical protein AVEN_201315-1 [Araneus ventricosus]|uniref:STPR domain-containing protein n=1 Tax=Araneus ventricosus TaxID=182803 RepID=A0A4Y2KEY9_ARAVE|nr:hypothetical protein AVEN_201315-1 [Araneus ventricosus]